MVDGLLAAAEMAEMVASAKETEADRRLARKDLSGAAITRAVALEMRGFAQALHSRAQAIDTGDYVPIGDNPGPGWRRRKRTKTGSNTVRIRMPKRRRTWEGFVTALGKWWSG